MSTMGTALPELMFGRIPGFGCSLAHFFNIFSLDKGDIFDKVTCILSDIIEEVANCMIDISDKAEKILAEHAPASLKGQCGDIAKIHHRLDVAAFLLEELIKENKLIVPNEKTPLFIWGVKA